MKVIHVLNHSFPHLDGYSVRSRNIIEDQRKRGWTPVVVTSPQHEPQFESPVEMLDGTRYYRTPPLESRYPPIARELAMMSRLKGSLRTAIGQENPDIIHAHSPCHWGVVSGSLARAAGIPFVYEIRSFWEDGIIDEGRDPRWSVKYHATRRIECGVARKADAVVAISRGLLDDLRQRGLRRSNMFVVPNGVEAGKFSLPLDLKSRSGGCLRLAYIGSLYPWEGLDTLIRSILPLRAQLTQTKLTIVGDGVERPRLEALVRDLGLCDCVEFTGRVNHDDIAQFYADADICVYPRNSSRTTELVTPLKPLEALAVGKFVIASRVGGLVELLSGAQVEYFTPEDPDDLAAACMRAVEHRDGWVGIAEKNRAFVLGQKTWEAVLEEYETVYEAARA